MNIDDIHLHDAVENQDVELVSQLIQHGDDIHAKDIDGETPLHYAAKQNSENAVAMARLLLNAGADIHDQDGHGMTPFMIAAASSHVEMLRFLLSRCLLYTSDAADD